jgi:ubiquinone/menaquinone biosynthesis C-methylase UbiE
MAENEDKLLAETYSIERSKWDSLAREKFDVSKFPMEYSDFEDYSHRLATMAGVSEFLGSLQGKQVLEIGCGLGKVSVLLAKSGANVTAFDLSSGSVAVARELAKYHNVAENVRLVVAAGETLPFSDESFDIIFGKGILHHLDAHFGAPELRRVLKTGGRAAFVEPMGMNPVLNVVRDHVPYKHKNPRGADIPLSYNDIHNWTQGFKEATRREMQLFSMLERGLGFKRELPALRRLDRVALKHVPFLRRYCRYVGIFLTK